MSPTRPITPTRHLDIGCGLAPRNPYHRDHLVGLDVRALAPGQALPGGFEYVQGNFVIEPLPFADHHFDSVSAYDVIEHVPRQLFMPGEGLVYPFIRVMNEIHRVLRPGGLFLASTPAYPRPEAFQDPTHVNIITVRTAEYFCGPEPKGRMYGFNGRFDEQINRFCTRNNYVDRDLAATRIWARRWHRKLLRGGWSDLIWEFKAA